MKYALVNGELQEAQPGLSGKCKSCDHPTIARCGKKKIWHWAHIGKLMCDPWWENETEWHREWKGQFPKEFQEVSQYAANGEKHIADVKIDKGYVIEFQRSSIEPEERQARENFYQKMIWIVDGTRRSKDKDKFINELKDAEPADGNLLIRRFRGPFNKSTLLKDWDGRNVPVFFDFKENIMWGLLPKTVEKRVYIVGVERNALIASLYPAEQMKSLETLLQGWAGLIASHENFLRWIARGRPPMRRYL